MADLNTLKTAVDDIGASIARVGTDVSAVGTDVATVIAALQAGTAGWRRHRRHLSRRSRSSGGLARRCEDSRSTAPLLLSRVLMRR